MELFELHGKLAFADFIVGEDLGSVSAGEQTRCQERSYFQVTCQPNLLACPNEPFCWVVLIPLDGVSVVHRKLEAVSVSQGCMMEYATNLMMKIVVAFAYGHECRDHMVSRGMLIIKRTFSQPMGQRIDTERALWTC